MSFVGGCSLSTKEGRIEAWPLLETRIITVSGSKASFLHLDSYKLNIQQSSRRTDNTAPAYTHGIRGDVLHCCGRGPAFRQNRVRHYLRGVSVGPQQQDPRSVVNTTRTTAFPSSQASHCIGPRLISCDIPRAIIFVRSTSQADVLCPVLRITARSHGTFGRMSDVVAQGRRNNGQGSPVIFIILSRWRLEW